MVVCSDTQTLIIWDISIYGPYVIGRSYFVGNDFTYTGLFTGGNDVFRNEEFIDFFDQHQYNIKHLSPAVPDIYQL
jgi:hypothetical protein